MTKLCWKGRAFKALSFGTNSKKAGRNFSGGITIYHRGGGAKRLFRRIDFQRKNLAKGFIERIEYDPNRTARIALVRWSNIKLSDSVEKSERALRAACGPQEEGASAQHGHRVAVLRTSPVGWTTTTTVLRTSHSPVASSSKKLFMRNARRRKAALHARQDDRFGDGFTRLEATPIGRQSINYGVNRMAYSSFSYILASDQLKSGDEVFNIDMVRQDEAQSEDRVGREQQLTASAKRRRAAEDLYQKSGISLPLWLAPLGSVLHNIELYPGAGGKLARAAGTSAQLVQKPPTVRPWIKTSPQPPNAASSRSREPDGRRAVKRCQLPGRSEGRTPLCQLPLVHPSAPSALGGGAVALRRNSSFGECLRPYSALTANAPKVPNGRPYMCTIRLPSGQQQLLDLRCRATIGVVSNIDHRARIFYKAGQRRWLGFRPVVRGVAMNPIDHPHGGGEGRTKGGRPSVSPWGKPTKGPKVRSSRSRKGPRSGRK